MSPLQRLFAGTALLLAVYFAVPVQADANLIWRIGLTALGLAGAGAIVVRQVRRQIRGNNLPLYGLVLAMIGGVLAFALADYIIAFTQPGQFVDLNTRLDALYFALTTLATVGYGDVHAQGQLARAVVSLQLVFNLVVLATATSVIVAKLRARRH